MDVTWNIGSLFVKKTHAGEAKLTLKETYFVHNILEGARPVALDFVIASYYHNRV